MKKLKIVLSLIALLFCGIVIFIPKMIKSDLVQSLETKKVDENFNENNKTALWVDSFKTLALQAYPQRLIFNNDGNQLILTLSDEDLASFYNHNETLLEVKRQGFSLEMGNNELITRLKLEGNVVKVPNDILLNMLKRIQK